jgi:outer membrane lipoprotein-sorting protein
LGKSRISPRRAISPNFWAGEQVTGAVTLRGRGADQFRLDASLPQGTRSWAVSDGQGSISEPTGKTSLIPPSNGLNLGALTLPFLGVYAALTDPTVSISPAAQVTLASKPAYDIRVQRTFAQKDDPTGELTKWSVKDYLIDASTLTLLETRDTAYPNDAPKQAFVREVIFSDYRTTNGMLVPFSITEKIAGQQTWTIQLNAISFNTGLTDANFKL